MSYYNTYNNSQKGLRFSLLLMDSKRMRISNTGNGKLLVFLNFAETFKKVLNLVTLLFDPPSLFPFLRDFIF